MNKMEVEDITNLYNVVLADIHNGVRLEEHRQDLQLAIGILNQASQLAKESGESTDGLDRLKNELYYLVYEIAERT